MTNSKKNKGKTQKGPSNDSASNLVSNALDGSMFTGSLSMTGYFSIVGIHTTLWVFVALYLPRTTFLTELEKPQWDQTPVSSRDRPQHPFLEPLTANPLRPYSTYVWWAGWMRDWWIELGVRGTEEERRTEKAFHDRQKMTISRNAWAATFTGSLVIHLIFILFGAPITRLAFKTYLLALLISIMTVYSPAYTIGVPSLGANSASLVKRWTWVRLFAEFSARNGVERALLFPAVGTVAGCWLGVIPIALDWDRPWQAWPLTPAFGAIGGYIISSIAALTVNAVIHLAHEHSRTQQDATEQKSK
ncbi:GPI biosynthesis protein family Pig-F-domain-containing protein [Flammula alnicola]|nr:GPI biosynthesis protein family Pig-F-domain-containing protein [Flammula alnicola]